LLVQCLDFSLGALHHWRIEKAPHPQLAVIALHDYLKKLHLEMIHCCPLASSALSRSQCSVSSLLGCQHTGAFAAADTDLKPVTINITLRTLRRALNLAVAWGKITAAPKFPLVQGERRRERVLTVAEFEKYLACQQPWRDVVILLYGTAVRPSEGYTLRWENVLLNGRGLISIATGKSKAARRVLPLMPAVYTALLARWEAAGKPAEGWVFPGEGVRGHVAPQTLRYHHAAALERSGVKAFEPYVFRHSALTRLAESGCDAFTLARIAGHSSITMTQRYCHPQAEAIDRAFAKLGSEKGVTDGGYQLPGEVMDAANHAASPEPCLNRGL
jgi:integrase